MQSTTHNLTFVVDSLYEQFIKQTKPSVTDIHPLTTTKSGLRDFNITKLWRIVAATICIVGLVGGLILAITLQSSNEPHADVPVVPIGPSTPTDDSLLNLDYESLVELYNATNGQYWHNNDGWVTNNNVCSWHGVTCATFNDRVDELNLASNNLTGYLPANISNLVFLRILTLSNNSIQGTIPNNIVNLKPLKKINLNYNMIEGTIPVNMGEMPNLHVLYLKNNQISGRIPYSLAESKAISDLDLAYNMMGGGIPDFTSNTIHFLDLSNNRFWGDIPLFSSTISHLYLAKNRIIGPTWKLQSLPQIEVLNLDGNQLEGEFRLTESQHRQLSMLNIANNSFTSIATDGIQHWKKNILCDATGNNFACPLDPNLIQKCYISCK